MLSLKAVLGAISAMTAIIVAAVTLSLTLTSSIDALRSIGTKHADALLTIAEGETSRLFKRGSDMVEQVVNVTGTRARPGPRTDASTLLFTETLVHSTLVRGMPQVASINIVFRDNTEIMGIFGNPLGTFILQSIIPDAAFDPANPVLGSVTRRLSLINASTQIELAVPPSLEVALATGRPRVTGVWAALEDINTLSGGGPFVTPPLALPTLDGVWETVPMSGPIYPPGVARTNDNVYAYAIVTVAVNDLSNFLRATRSTPGTVSFAYGLDGYVVGTSGANLRREMPISTNPVPTGCIPTNALAITGGSANFTHRLVCRYHVSEYPHEGLKALYKADRALLFPRRGRIVGRETAGGETYFVASAAVSLAFPGQNMFLTLLMPEGDVLGDVISSRNVAIGITCALVVFAVALNVCVVVIVLSPLNSIADRMMRAANLDDDGMEEELSAMAEVARLQEAYNEMNLELNRIRAYVPQTVLLARKVANGDDDDADTDLETPIDQSVDDHADDPTADTRSTRSMRSTGSRRSRNTRATRKSNGSDDGVGGTIAAVPTAGDLQSRSVSVICANVVGLHGAISSPPFLLAEIGAAAHAMEAAVTSRRGALTFHGDRFLATFNAAQPCAGHAVKAASAAVAATLSHESGTGLRLSAGVATGTCTVGPVGSATLKAFSVVGPTVTTAGILERLSARAKFGDAERRVLASHRTASEATTVLQVEFVDLLELGSASRPTSIARISAVPKSDAESTSSNTLAPTADHANDEWMYVMVKASPFNAVFDELHRGRVAAAHKLFHELIQDAAAKGHAASPPERLAAMMAVVDAAPGGAENVSAASLSRPSPF